MKTRVFVIFILLLSSLAAGISADNNIQSVEDPSNNQIANQLYDFTTDKPSTQIINDAISDKRIINNNPPNSVEYVSQVDKLDTVIASGEISVVDNVDWDQSYVISGILQASTPWSFANVELYINETLFEVTVTDGNGAYTFTLTFDRTNITGYEYRVYFPNDEEDEFRVPGDIKLGEFIVQDTTVITFTVDKDSVGPQETYTVTVTVKDAGGSDVDPNSAVGLVVKFSESYGIGTNEGNETYSGNVNFNAGTSSYSSKYHTDIESNDTITVTATLVGTGNFTLINFGTPGTIQITVTSLIINTLTTADIGGVAINETKHYYRLGQLIELESTLTSSTSSVNDRDYYVTITGGGYTGGTPASGVSDLVGVVSFSISLTLANFPDPSVDITITILFNETDLIVPSLRSVDILLIEDLKALGGFGTSETLNSSLHVEDLSFFPGVNDQITITGKVLDKNGEDAKNVYLILSLNNKDYYNESWAGHSRLWYTPGIKTNSTGFFKYTITNFNYVLSITGWMTFNVTIDPALNTNYADPNKITNEALSFRHFRTIITTVDQDTSGANVTLSQNVISSFDRFNDTFDVYTDSDRAIGSAFYPTITDSFGRVPVGVSYYYEIQGFYQGSTQTIAITSGTITITEGLSENNGVFELAFSTFATDPDYPALINSEGAYFRIFIRVAGQNADIATITYEHRYYTYGPDDTAPVISSVLADGADSGKEDNITIIATLDFTASHFDNIQSVTLYYRYSDNQADDLIDAVFTAGFNVESMAFNGLNYNFTISFVDHGRWVQWYIVVLDYSGNGLDVNGDTENPGLISYDNSVTLNDTWGTLISPVTSKMGDTDITTPDLNQDLLINGQLPVDSLNVTLFTNITIIFRLVVDDSGYDNNSLKIYIRYILYEPLNGTVLSTSAWVEYNLSYLYTFGGYEYYEFIIDVTASPLDWFTQVDYYFDFTDNAGNNGFTQPLSQLVESDDNLKETWVTDEVFPIETTGGNVTLPSQDGRNNTAFSYVLWTNETSYSFISYNVTDGAGSGLYNISVTFYVTFENGTIKPVETIYFVINGEIVDTGGLALDAAVQDFYLIEFGLPSDYFIDNYNISWEVHILDRANQVTVLNDQADDPIHVEIQLPPVKLPPPDDTDTIVFETDEDGNFITDDEGNFVPVQETSNIVWIMIGFIGGLTALILYYQRNNIKEYLARSARKKKVQGTLRDLTDEIKRLGQAGKYKAAILLTWEALERISKEIIQFTRPFNQTASEFVIYLSTITIVELETLMTLSTAFEKTRYGKDSPTEDDFDDAVKALLITAQTIIESGARVRFDEDDDF